MLAQRRRRLPSITSQLGQCIWVVAFMTREMKLSLLQQLPESNLCKHIAGLLLAHRQTRWINIKATLSSLN